MAGWAERMVEVGPTRFYDASGSVYPAIIEAAFVSPSDAPSAELRAAMADRRGPLSAAALVVAIVAFVFVMVFKSLS